MFMHSLLLMRPFHGQKVVNVLFSYDMYMITLYTRVYQKFWDWTYNVFLLYERYNSCRFLAFSTIFFHSWRSWACSVHLRSFIFFRSFLTSSSHLCLGLPTGRVICGCHLYIFLPCWFQVLYGCVHTSSVVGL